MAVDPTAVPVNVTCPLDGLDRVPQSTAVGKYTQKMVLSAYSILCNNEQCVVIKKLNMQYIYIYYIMTRKIMTFKLTKIAFKIATAGLKFYSINTFYCTIYVIERLIFLMKNKIKHIMVT